MRWRQKARIQKALAASPRGDAAYRVLQRRLGTLAPDPFKRLPNHAVMVRGLRRLGVELDGARCVEVGTGHMPIAPVAFWLAGAAEVVTVDLHRRLDLRLTGLMLARMAREADRVVELYQGVLDADAVRSRLELVGGLADRPLELLDRLGIRYLAPADAARLPHDADSVDVHFSMTVLEHIAPRALDDVLREARRVLAPDGVAVHFVDPSDHFAHQDRSITRINFLRFSEREWTRIAGNEFSYANRLRASQLHRAFTDAGLVVDRVNRTVDDASLAALRNGFPLDPAFQGFDLEDLCTTTWRVYARRA